MGLKLIFSPGKYILFLRRKAGDREILVKIVPNLLEHEIFKETNNKHLVHTTITAHGFGLPKKTSIWNPKYFQKFGVHPPVILRGGIQHTYL